MFTVLRPGHISDGGAFTISSTGVPHFTFLFTTTNILLRVLLLCFYMCILTISVFVCCLLFMYFTPVFAVSVTGFTAVVQAHE